MPAPAVIPALKVYINIVVVKTPVVYLRDVTTYLSVAAAVWNHISGSAQPTAQTAALHRGIPAG